MKRHRRLPLLSLAWLVYIIFTLTAYSMAGDSVMLLSIPLCGIATWLYNYRIGLLTALLSHPYHMLMLMYLLNSLDGWKAAIEIGGILAQLIAIGCIAVLSKNLCTARMLNQKLEQKINECADDLREVSDLLSNHAESEQTRLAEKLVSNVTVRITRLRRESETLQSLLAQEQLPQEKATQPLIDTAQKSIEFIQHLTRHLTNEKFTPQGLDQMIFELAQFYRDTTSTHLSVDLSHRHREIPPATRAILFRITNEAVTNAMRHGKAKHIFIELEVSDDSWQLTVINDGLPLPESVNEGMGIQLMKQRAQSVGAIVGYSSGPGGHTHLRCEKLPAPIKEK